MTHTVILKMPGQPERTVGIVEAMTRGEAAERVVRRYPFLPPAHVWIDDTSLAALRYTVPKPVAELTAGQKQHRERIARQRHAERWRQHWIDKDNAKKQRN